MNVRMTEEIVRSVKQILIALIVCGSAAYVGVHYVEQPSAPTPTPEVSELAELIPSEARPFISQFYSDLATIVEQPTVKTTGQFRLAQQLAVTIAQQAETLPSLAPVNEPISLRIEGAVGMEDRPLDDSSRSKLIACLQQISEDVK